MSKSTAPCPSRNQMSPHFFSHEFPYRAFFHIYLTPILEIWTAAFARSGKHSAHPLPLLAVHVFDLSRPKQEPVRNPSVRHEWVRSQLHATAWQNPSCKVRWSNIRVAFLRRRSKSYLLDTRAYLLANHWQSGIASAKHGRRNFVGAQRVTGDR